MRKITTLLAALLLAGLSTFVLASPGGLDKFGGHVDHATGKYHYHRDKNGNKLVPPVEAPNPNIAGNTQGAPVTATKAEKAGEPVKAEKEAAVTAVAPAAAAASSAPAEKQSKKAKKAEKKAEKKAAKKAAKAEKTAKAAEKKEATPEAAKK